MFGTGPGLPQPVLDPGVMGSQGSLSSDARPGCERPAVESSTEISWSKFPRGGSSTACGEVRVCRRLGCCVAGRKASSDERFRPDACDILPSSSIR